MDDAVRIVVPGPVPRKNDRNGTRAVWPKDPNASACPHCGHHPRLDPFVQFYPTESWKDWIARLQLEVGALSKVDRGAWRIEIHHYSPNVRHLDGDTLHVAYGDADSPTSAVLDGLKAVGVIDDDERFVAEAARKHIDKRNPRTEIILTREPGSQLDLLGTIERAPARPKPPKGRPKPPKGGARKPGRPQDLDDF